jgi:hypothetical protein
MYGILCREITKYTVKYSEYIRFWPTLGMRVLRLYLESIGGGGVVRLYLESIGGGQLVVVGCSGSTWSRWVRLYLESIAHLTEMLISFPHTLPHAGYKGGQQFPS